MRATRLQHLCSLALFGGLLFQSCQLIVDPRALFALTQGLNSCSVEFDDGELEEVDCRDDDFDDFLVVRPGWSVF